MAGELINKENQWLLKIAEGDEFAFRRLVDAYYNKLGTFVLGLTGSRQLTEELVQDVFLKVWQNRDKLHSIENFDAWLFILTRNHTFNSLKQIAGEAQRRARWEKEVAASVDETEDIDRQNELYHEWLEEAIGRLPPQQQKIYLLSRREGLSSMAITKLLGLSIDTVKKHRSRAVKNVKAYLLQRICCLSIFFLF